MVNELKAPKALFAQCNVRWNNHWRASEVPVMSSVFSKTFRNCSGLEIPVLGLGTFEASDDVIGRCAKAVEVGLQAGYRHIDTGAVYGCEEEVGEGMRDSGIPRKDVFLCNKLSAPSEAYLSGNQQLTLSC
jgi:diketogulonate reductase-like aldo/keto reductase